MDWKILLVLGALAIYWAYNMTVLAIFGAPYSLSKTYYLYQERKSWQRFMFPAMMVSMAGLLLPAWLEISEGSSLQFMAFFAAAGIIFTGVAAAFMESKMTFGVHTAGAVFAAVFSLLWIIFVAHLWYFIVVWLVLVLIVALLSKTLKTSYVYWFETIAFMSTFTAIIAYFVG